MKKVKISVVIPVYKVEAYLERCVTSVLNQSMNDLEVILVDDGSPDHCPVICDEYANQDERVKVIHKENGGLSSARNAGLKKACGEYISLIDSDDFVAPNFYEVLLGNAIKNDADISERKLYQSSRRKYT